MFEQIIILIVYVATIVAVTSCVFLIATLFPTFEAVSVWGVDVD